MIKEKDLKVFSFIWAGIFILLGILQNINELYVLASIFILLGILHPTLLTSFYKVWIRLGEFIGGIISRVIIFILYFGLFTPVAMFLKLLGKDLLRKKINKNKFSYWVERERQPESMKNQF